MPSEQIALIIAEIRAMQPTERLTIEQWRQRGKQQEAQTELVAARLLAANNLTVETGDVDRVPCEWISGPQLDGQPLMLFLHGGGFVYGSAKAQRLLATRLALVGQVRLVSIDYRLAPEYPFPAGLEDCLTVYRWLIQGSAEPHRFLIGGMSAGGGLTLSSLVALRNAGDPLPAAAVCLSPTTDFARTGGSFLANASRDPLLREDDLRQGMDLYLGDTDPRDALASPLYADLTGLPPLFIQVGSAEMLLDDATRFAERARSAGVSVTLDIWEDMFHGWYGFTGRLPEAAQAIDRAGEFIRGQTREGQAGQ